MAASSELSELILRSLETYNRYRSPEARARLLNMYNQGFTIEFDGVFCQSCEVQEYFEDFIYELKRLNKEVDAEIQGYEQVGSQRFKVRYLIKNPLTADDPNKKLFAEFLKEQGLTLEEYEASGACTKDVIRFHYRTWLSEKGINEN